MHIHYTSTNLTATHYTKCTTVMVKKNELNFLFLSDKVTVINILALNQIKF